MSPYMKYLPCTGCKPLTGTLPVLDEFLSFLGVFIYVSVVRFTVAYILFIFFSFEVGYVHRRPHRPQTVPKMALELGKRGVQGTLLLGILYCFTSPCPAYFTSPPYASCPGVPHLESPSHQVPINKS